MSTWPCYRLVTEHLATWTEVTTSMSIDDVELLCIAADAMFDAQNSEPPEPPRTPRGAHR